MSYHLSKPSSILCLLVLFLGFACGHHHHDPVLEEAAAIHTEAVKIEASLKDRIGQLIQQRNGIAVQGRELTEAELNFTEAIDRIESTHTWWKDNHVEVPGYEHGHVHGPDCKHGPELEVVPADMLLLQQEFRDSILVLQQLVQAISSPVVE